MKPSTPATASGPADDTLSDSRPALEMTDVRKVYRMGDGSEVVALDHATLSVVPGELVALVGPSGSGKTTLCSVAGGILEATEGRVVVGGEDITDQDRKSVV